MQNRQLLDEGLRQLGVDVRVSEERRDRLLLFLEELYRWNRRINLTRISGTRAGIEKHLLDSLVLLNWLESGESLLDIGSGAGLPGIPLAIAQPGRRIMSVESIGKKVHFQKHIKRSLQLENLDIIHERSEQLALGKDRTAGVITGRALSSLSGLARVAAPHLNRSGRIIALRGRRGRDELDREGEELAALGIRMIRTIPYQLPFSHAQRIAVVMARACDE